MKRPYIQGFHYDSIIARRLFARKGDVGDIDAFRASLLCSTLECRGSHFQPAGACRHSYSPSVFPETPAPPPFPRAPEPRAYFRTTAVTTPAIRSSCCGLMGLYFGFAGTRYDASPLFFRNFMVHSPSTSAITMSPLFAVWPRSTMTRSPGRMPAPVMESPETLSRKEASGFVTRNSSRERVSLSSSSAGLGNPASTRPRTRYPRGPAAGAALPLFSPSAGTRRSSRRWTIFKTTAPVCMGVLSRGNESSVRGRNGHIISEHLFTCQADKRSRF